MFTCYRQLEHSDCGLTCIRIIAKHFGKKIPISYLKGITDLNRLGMSIKDITECCSKLGIDTATVKLKPDEFVNAPLPAIVYWQQQHFVVVYKIEPKRGKYYVADPAQGKIAYSSKSFEKYWIPEGDERGVVILTDSTEEFSNYQYPKDSPWKNFIYYLLQYIKEYRKYFTLLCLLSLGIAFADLTLPVLLKKSVDAGIGERDIHLVFILLLTQFAIAIGGLVSSGIMTLLMTRTGLNVYLNMASKFLFHLSKLPVSFFDKRVSYDFVQKISDQSRIKDFLLSFPNSILIMSLTLIVFSILLFHYSHIIFVLFLSLSLLEIIWDIRFLNKRKSIDYSYFIASAENRNHAYELTNGMADLKVNNAEMARIEQWNESQKNVNATGMRSARLDFLQGGGKSVISRIKDLSVTGVGAMLVIGGDLTMGGLLTLGYITGRLALPFSNISTSMSSFQQGLLSYQRIEEVMQEKDIKTGLLPYSTSTLSFMNVWFKFAGSASPYVIRDLTLDIKEGETVALVGESGCGKSTLIKLMLGFYNPSKGAMQLSDHNSEDMDPSDWLAHCGVVMQTPRIFSGTIKENVSLSDLKPSEEKVKNMLKIVGLDDFVQSLPMGMNTKIGVAGIEMSGGQKQRLMIARALYKDPDILFLDEATSSLDANNEKNIINNIIKMSKGKTVIIAAHRLSTVKTADKIVYMKDGKAIEIGTHKELSDLKGEYWNLVKNQITL